MLTVSINTPSPNQEISVFDEKLFNDTILRTSGVTTVTSKVSGPQYTAEVTGGTKRTIEPPLRKVVPSDWTLGIAAP